MAMDTDAQEELEPRRRGGIFRFWGEVRAEARKVTWATRQEVTVSTVMVVIMTIMAALFFFVVDFVVRNGIGFILSHLG